MCKKKKKGSFLRTKMSETIFYIRKLPLGGGGRAAIQRWLENQHQGHLIKTKKEWLCRKSDLNNHIQFPRKHNSFILQYRQSYFQSKLLVNSILYIQYLLQEQHTMFKRKTKKANRYQIHLINTSILQFLFFPFFCCFKFFKSKNRTFISFLSHQF